MWQHLRRRWLSLGRHRALNYWILLRGVPLLVLFGSIFVLNGVLIGWRQAYDVAVLITSPAATSSPLAAWLLSVAGWLLMPAIAGAVAGYIINSAVGGRRTRPIDEVFPDDDR
jgi:hypothetical protein